MLESDADLRTVYKQPTAPAVAKDIGCIDVHCRRFIERSAYPSAGQVFRDQLAVEPEPAVDR